jgi:hypothetical protein
LATKLTEESLTVNGSRQGVADLAESLGVGQWASRMCPDCEGGASKERSLSLNVQQNGVIAYYCHRNACGFKGTIYINPAEARLGVHDAHPLPRQRPVLEEPVAPLSEREKAFFLSRYGINDTESKIYRTDTRYALPILRPDGTRRGFITRRPYDGSPGDTAANRNDYHWSNKTLTYLEAEEPCQSWYGHAKEGYSDVILVEDPLSAMRIVEFKPTWCAVALLGTGVNAEKIAEIQRKVEHVYIALDADATGQAFAMARKWGSAFASCRVIVLSKDIKDSTDEELASLPL